jgi:hypothetical protein
LKTGKGTMASDGGGLPKPNTHSAHALKTAVGPIQKRSLQQPTLAAFEWRWLQCLKKAA